MIRKFTVDYLQLDRGKLMSGNCKVYGDLTLKYSDLTCDDNLADLFTEVLARREQLTKQTNNNKQQTINKQQTNNL